MTFKHTKFEDSPVMRSLEKVARERGLVKEPTVLEKIASRPANKKLDITPTSSMMDNIFKLTAGLRAKGLVKEAAELEQNYFNYKQAQTLYEAHKETGEDVVHSAHPKGSHKLEGVEGEEATFEDILDKHVKFLNMVEKKPTGKLSSSAHVLSEVKKALGQFVGEMPSGGVTGGGVSSTDQHSPAKNEMVQANADVQAAIAMATKGGGLTSIVQDWARGRAAIVTSAMTTLTPDTINDAKSAISAISRNLHPNALHNFLPEFLNKGISTDALWGVIDQKLNSAQAHCDAAIQHLAQAMAEEATKTSSVSRRMQQLMAIAQADPEALKKGKEAMVQALQLVDRGLGEFLNTYYGAALEQVKGGIDYSRKQIADKIQKIKDTGDGNFPTQLMNDISAQIVAAKDWVDKQRKFFSEGEGKFDDATWWRKFNYAASLVGQGQSMSWGAAQAINEGDLSGLAFHAAHISADEVMNTINISLVRPLTQIKNDLSGIDKEQIKSPKLKQVFPALLDDVSKAVSSAQAASGNIIKASDPNLRVIHPSKIAAAFGPPLDKDNRGVPIFAKVTDLNSFKAKCNYIVSIYQNYLKMIKQSVGTQNVS